MAVQCRGGQWRWWVLPGLLEFWGEEVALGD